MMIEDTLGNIGKISMCKRILKNQTSPVGEIPFYKISTFGGVADSYISRELYDDYKKRFSFPKKGDILISAAGTLGKTVIYDGTDAFFQDSNIVWIDNDETKVLNKYLYYYYQLKPWKKTTGSTIERLYNDNLRKIKIRYPKSKSEQEKLIEPLVKIDKLIENNNKIYEDLLRINRTLYDFWFNQIEYSYNYIGCNKDLKLNEIIKKEIPVDWKAVPLKDCLEHINTGLNPRKNFILNNGNIKYITVKNLTNDGKIDFYNCDTIDEEAFKIINKRSKLTKGDILFSSISPIGRCFLIGDTPKEWNINESVFSIRADNSIISPEYLYLFLTSDYFIKTAENSSTGSIFNGIRIKTLENIHILVPDKRTMDLFTNSVKKNYEMMNNIVKLNYLYESLKGLLLPLLLTGKVNRKQIV